MHKRMTILVAALAHAVNFAYCRSIRDESQVPWADAPEWQRDSVINGVEFIASNPGASAAENHENWMALKVSEGWVYGPVKDEQAKTHPCIMPYDDLPAEQRAKNEMFMSLVKEALAFIETDGCPFMEAENLSDELEIRIKDQADLRARALPPPEPGHRWVQQRID